MWAWIGIAVGSLLGLSLFMGLAVARIFGTIGREISELYDTGAWATRKLSVDGAHGSSVNVGEDRSTLPAHVEMAKLSPQS